MSYVDVRCCTRNDAAAPRTDRGWTSPRGSADGPQGLRGHGPPGLRGRTAGAPRTDRRGSALDGPPGHGSAHLCANARQLYASVIFVSTLIACLAN